VRRPSPNGPAARGCNLRVHTDRIVSSDDLLRSTVGAATRRLQFSQDSVSRMDFRGTPFAEARNLFGGRPYLVLAASAPIRGRAVGFN
jgi:hypothetical protein